MRQFLAWLEFWFLLLVQLLCICWYLTLLFSAALVQAQSTNAPADQLPAKLGSFLSQYPVTKSQPKLLTTESMWQLGEEAFVGVRAFKDKDAKLLPYNARESFRAECTALGGQFETNANRADIAAYFSMAKRATFNGNDLSVCVDANEIPLGALVARSYSNRYHESFVSLFVLSQETATEMMAIYHRGMAKELRHQADIAEQLAATDARIADWRKRLAIGTETHCGPVLEIRGPVAQVAYGTRAGWVRIERLYPPQDASSCWEFSN
jgi:hypothetical protein